MTTAIWNWQSLVTGMMLRAGRPASLFRVAQRASVRFDDGCVRSVRQAAERLSISHQDIYSGAGHDACNLALAVPTGMIFVPCEGGISHNERENARPGDLADGCSVLLQVLMERAG